MSNNVVKKYDAIDGLKVIACLGVILVHMRSNGGYVLNPNVVTIIDLCKSMLNLFFIVSAFGMCCGYYNRILENKICIVTGATRGIGKAIAELFANEGAEVIVNGTKRGSAEEWIAQNENREHLYPYYFDITDSSAVRQNILDIKKKFGHIDILVNNAGVEFNELIGMISREKMEKMFNVNVYGTIEMIQTVSRIMGRNENGGCIINISSMVGLRGNAGQLVYSATKGAVIALTKSAAKELAPKNIRVNSIAPGLTQTEMMAQTDLDKLQGRINNICIGRIAKPTDIAGACLLLASDYAGYISGQIIPVDGCTIM